MKNFLVCCLVLCACGNIDVDIKDDAGVANAADVGITKIDGLSTTQGTEAGIISPTDAYPNI